MKANELMSGDYLSYNGQIIKVASITKKKVGYHIKENECRMHYARLCECNPVSITPEILEKNGIKWLCTEPSGRKTYCCNEPVVQCTYIPNSGWFINVGACGSIKVRFVETSKIQYVHELQHALILCEIEKEIIV